MLHDIDFFMFQSPHRQGRYDYGIYSGLYLRVQKHILPNNHIIPLETIMSGEMINMIPQKYTSADLRTARIYIGAMNPVSSGIELSGPKTLIYENGIFLVDPLD